MAFIKHFVLAILVAWCVLWWEVEGGAMSNVTFDESEVKVREKRFVDPLSLIGLIVSVGATIQGAICTFSSVCSKDEITPRLKKIEAKLQAIHNDIKSIKKDVQEIWSVSQRKWYFDRIKYIANQRKKVIRDLKIKDTSNLAIERQQKFITEILGGDGQDNYVQNALFHIKDLITEKGFATRYYRIQTDNGKSPAQAAKLTWIFIRKMFRYQEDGYASVVLAASLKYKNDNASYKSKMREVCTWWPKLRDALYTKLCSKLGKDSASTDRRKMQQDVVFALRDLSVIPIQLVQTDCSKFADSYTLLYSNGYLYVAQPEAKKIMIVKPETLNVVKTIPVPGSECGGNCHPYGISIHKEKKLLAVAAKSSLSGGKSKVILFKINGDLSDPSGISLEHYYTLPQLFPAWQPHKTADVIGVAFCGKRIAYADFNGKITAYDMPGRYTDFDMLPHMSRMSWALRRQYNMFYDHQYYFGCSNDGKYFVFEATDDGKRDEGVGALPADDNRGSSHVLRSAKFKVKVSDWYDRKDGRSRMHKLKGIAMDKKHNLFYSSERGGRYYNTVAGVYGRTYEGKRHYIREWERQTNVKMFGMAVDDKRFLYSVEKIGSGGKCLYKFDYGIDLEDINIP